MSTDNKSMDNTNDYIVVNGKKMTKGYGNMIDGVDAFNTIIESMKGSDLMKELDKVEFIPLNGEQFLTYLVNVYKDKTISTSDREMDILRNEIEESIRAFIDFYRSFKSHHYHEKVYTTKYYEDIIDNLLKANTESYHEKKLFNNSVMILPDPSFDTVIRYIKDPNGKGFSYAVMTESDCVKLIDYVEYLEKRIKEMNNDMVEYGVAMDTIAKLKEEKNDLIDFIKKYL